MPIHTVAQALRYLVVLLLVVLMAGTSSGTVWPDIWSQMVGADSAVARAFPAPAMWAQSINDAADNGPVCTSRPGPRVQTTQDATGSLRVTITAGTDPQGFPVRLREIRIGPMQNAAVSGGGFTARTTPLVVTVPGSTQAVLGVTRIVAGQPSHVTLIVMDDCGDWPTFVGGGTGVAVAPPGATATPIPAVPGQPTGSIPLTVSVSGSSTQYPPGSRPRVEIRTRPLAACNLAVTWPDGRVESLPATPANAFGVCQYRPTVPADMRSGNATATGTAQDLYGFNVQHVPFRIGGSLSTIPPGDNILAFTDEWPEDNTDADQSDDGEPDNDYDNVESE